ncbi:MAG: hypothetical protein IPH45_11175 [Bacteroidales bacterium]|nr:hypothetical protein [Bacteroidales bacterium]
MSYDNYNQTTNPNHVTSQFATTCQDCHTQTAWVPSTFDHDNTYPLTGAHATIAQIVCNAIPVATQIPQTPVRAAIRIIISRQPIPTMYRWQFPMNVRPVIRQIQVGHLPVSRFIIITMY